MRTRANNTVDGYLKVFDCFIVNLKILNEIRHLLFYVENRKIISVDIKIVFDKRDSLDPFSRI